MSTTWDHYNEHFPAILYKMHTIYFQHFNTKLKKLCILPNVLKALKMLYIATFINCVPTATHIDMYIFYTNTYVKH